MHEDLELFLNIINDLLKDETLHPVAKPINAKELYNQLDLSLNEQPALKEDFKKSLKNLVLKTPNIIITVEALLLVVDQ